MSVILSQFFVDLVLYILGYGSVVGESGEHYSKEAVKLANEHFSNKYKIQVIDVVGNPKLIDDLQYLCNKKPWPLIFFKGKYLGGYTNMVELIAREEKKQ